MRVLHVDDSQDDLDCFKAALKKLGVSFRLHALTDGLEAMNYLKGKGAYANRFCYPLPHLIVLDLKMPKVDGFEFLKWRQARFPNLPTFVLTGSISKHKAQRAVEMGASGVFCKPVSFAELQVVLRKIFHLAMIPQPEQLTLA